MERDGPKRDEVGPGRAVRLVVEGLAALTEQFRELREEWEKESEARTKHVREQVVAEMRAYVPWIAIVALVGLIWVMTDKQVSPVKASADAAISKSIATEKALADFARDYAIASVRQEAKLDALVRVNVQNEKPSVAKEELERRTGEKRTPRKEK